MIFPDVPIGTIVRYTSRTRDMVVSVAGPRVFDDDYSCYSITMRVLYPIVTGDTGPHEIGSYFTGWEDLCTCFEVIE